MDNDYNGYGAVLAIWLILIPILLILSLAGYLIGSFFLMKIFEKAGVQGRWRAWVPVYNLLVFAKLGDLSPWVMLGAILISLVLSQIPLIGGLLSLVATAASVLAGWRIGLKLGKDWPYLLLWLIPIVGVLIWLGILAFDKSRWNAAVPPAPWAGNFLADKTVWAGIPAQQSSIGYAGPGGAAPGGYPPPGYQQPPQGYTQPPQGYTQPPQGYTQPPQAYQPPPAGYAPPPSAAAASAPPPTSPEPPVSAPPASTSPPAAVPVQPPAAPDFPPASTQPPVAQEPPVDPDAPRP